MSISRLQKSISVLFLLTCFYGLSSQNMIPRVDELAHRGKVISEDFSDDQKYHATMDESSLAVRHVETGKLIYKKENEQNLHYKNASVKFIDNNHTVILVTQENRNARLYLDDIWAQTEHEIRVNKLNLKSREKKTLLMFKTSMDTINSIKYSPDKTSVALYMQGYLSILNIEQDTCKFLYSSPYVKSYSFLSNDKVLIEIDEGEDYPYYYIKTYNLKKKKYEGEPTKHIKSTPEEQGYDDWLAEREKKYRKEMEGTRFNYSDQYFNNSLFSYNTALDISPNLDQIIISSPQGKTRKYDLLNMTTAEIIDSSSYEQVVFNIDANNMFIGSRKLKNKDESNEKHNPEFLFNDKRDLAFQYFSNNSDLAIQIEVDTNYYVIIYYQSSREIIRQIEYPTAWLWSINSATFIEKENKVLLANPSRIYELDYLNDSSTISTYLYEELHPLDNIEEDIKNITLSSDDKYIYVEQEPEYLPLPSRHTVINRKTKEKLFTQQFDNINAIHQGKVYRFTLSTEYVFFHQSKPLAFLHDGLGNLKLYDLEKQKILITFKLFTTGDWLVYTPDGYYDGTPLGRDALYFIVENEVILQSQLKKQFWESRLLEKALSRSNALEKYEPRELLLYPEIETELLDSLGNFQIRLKERSGGIGKVSAWINGKRIMLDINKKRNPVINFNLNVFRDRLAENDTSFELGFKSYSKDSLVSSRLQKVKIWTNLNKSKSANASASFSAKKTPSQSPSTILKPGLYGLFIGCSEYKDNTLDLSFADNDAIKLKDALDKIRFELYDSSRVYLKTLTSVDSLASLQSTKENIVRELKFIVDNAKPNDVVVISFSGHGITLNEDFYFMTSDAGLENWKTDSKKRKKVCVSSEEFMNALTDIKSNKQVLILDACHSGQIAKIYENKARASSTSQAKALESLNENAGVYILASSEANQKSYESAHLDQGLLTYSLLLGMSGEAVTDEQIEITKLLSFASTQTREISKKLAVETKQRPVQHTVSGGQSFTIGLANPTLKIPLPTSLTPIGPPSFGILPYNIDTLNINRLLIKELQNHGAVGAQKSILYINNTSSTEPYKITGIYSLTDVNKISLDMHISKNNQVLFSKNKMEAEISELSLLIKMIIREFKTFAKSINDSE